MNCIEDNFAICQPDRLTMNLSLECRSFVKLAHVLNKSDRLSCLESVQVLGMRGLGLRFTGRRVQRARLPPRRHYRHDSDTANEQPIFPGQAHTRLTSDPNGLGKYN